MVAREAKLDVWQSTLRPHSAELLPLDRDRDAFHGESGPRYIYRMALSYTFLLEQSPSDIIFRVPHLSELLYSSPFEACFISIYDATRTLVATCDFSPDKIKLPPGRYTVRLLLRHESIDALRKQQNQPLSIERILSSPIAVP